MNGAVLGVVAAQGLWVRRRTPKLPPAGGATSGVVGDDEVGALRVAIVGESTAAGLGVVSHARGFPGCLARHLAERSGRSVRWQVNGRDGATIRRVRHLMLGNLAGDLDCVVLLIGVNDVLSRTPALRWGQDLAGCLDTLGPRSRQVVVPGIAPFERFPSLPTTLARYLAGRAQTLDDEARSVCDGRSEALWIPASDGLDVGSDFFASDGFHPSAAGYDAWARQVATHIRVA
jgi:lysophospholipase L1-like esterase